MMDGLGEFVERDGFLVCVSCGRDADFVRDAGHALACPTLRPKVGLTPGPTPIFDAKHRAAMEGA